MTDLDVSRFERVVFFTGAGLSVASGIATYRGKGGVWETYDFQKVACQEAFERDPEVVWDHHERRRAQMGAAEPNRAHEIMAAVEAAKPSVAVVTQNIDGLHQRAGSRNVTELHGSVWRVRCDRERRVWEEMSQPLPSRRCPCGAWLRPDIVWFGDSLDPDVLRDAVEAISRCDLLVSVGTSGVVFPAAELPRLARQAGATCVEVNPEPTPLSDIFDEVLRMTASEGLGVLWPDA